MPLRALQEGFQAHLLRGDLRFAACIAATPPLSADQRLSIYGSAYRARLREALQSSFVKLHLILGDDTFAALAAAFLARHPSTTRSIRWFGQHLADFLLVTEPYCEQPILAELASFEWALAGCFDAADATPLTRAQLAQVHPEQWGELRFAFHPSVRTLSLGWNTVAAWKALDAQAAPPPPERLATAMSWLLWRQDFQNRFRCIDAIEAGALAWAMDGASFAQVCEQLRHSVAEEQIALTAATLIANWADGGILVQPHQ